ncbi:ATP-grasp domain-containing protein [Agrilactobacillus yilanensis]|uniref:ATP-grasp domain-containing protein n=1 Tax=Agrilactobacillus yilanensis TaxID=2485997 RepID=A0ABW4J9P9_9LACO|nr:ATP-grasp domain-containing protein [Agrilactobacillus yilanensis]
MKVYVQSATNFELPYSTNGFIAMRGFHDMGFEVNTFKNIAELDSQLHSEDIVVGGVGTVRQRLFQLGFPAEEINYPEEIQSYLGRKLWFSHIDEVNRHPEWWPLFVKPVTGKKFTGKVIRTPKDMIGLGSYYDNAPVICSEVVNFVTEWRVYVRYGQILDVRKYTGDWRSQFDAQVIEQCIADYTTQKAGYSIDFGVTDTGKTLLIEVNEGYSLGAYGLQENAYAKLLAARWAEMTQTTDECAFDLE